MFLELCFAGATMTIAFHWPAASGLNRGERASCSGRAPRELHSNDFDHNRAGATKP